MGVYDYDKTAANNSTVGGVSVAEGMAPGNVNNAIRGEAAELAEWRDDMGGALTSGGAANVQTLTTNSTITAYADGQELGFVAGFANTAAATLNVDGVGAKAIRKEDDQALTGGELKAGGHYTVRYDASANSAAGAWLLLNPSNYAQYETGTWTPVLKGQDAAGSATYSTNEGAYTRIGDTVIAHFRMVLTSKASVSGNIYIEGLPYDCHVDYFGTVTIGLISGMLIDDNLSALVDNNSDQIHFYVSASTSTTTRVTNTGMLGTMQIIGTATYKTDEAFGA